MNKNIINCACGCGTEFEEKDKWGRPRKFVSGHNGKKYDDPKQAKRVWNHRNRKKRYKYKSLHLRSLKAELVLYFGGKCNRCHYTYNGKNAAGFDFHHVDSKEKLFNVGINSFNQYSKEANYEEAKKCELLCAICHRLHHSSEY